MWAEVIRLFDHETGRWLLPDGAIIAQIHPVEHQDLALQQLVLYDRRKYGSTLLCFYELADEGE
jgi:16S rRNA G966 N2-methylase RsmD